MVIVTFELEPGHRRRRAGRARPRRLGRPAAARRHRTAAHPEAEQRADADAVGGAVRQPVDPRADGDCRQDGEGGPRALHRRRRSADRRRPRARGEHLGRGRSPRRLSPADCRGPQRAAAAERRRARRQRHHQPVRAHAADDGPLHRGVAVQRAGRRHPQCAADPRARHRLRGGRHQGTALAGHAERRARRGARRAAAVRRQHGRGDRGRQGHARARPPAAAARRVDAGGPRSVDAHLRLAARDQRPPGARQHPRLPRGLRLHARLARHGHRRRRHSRPRWSPPSA